MGQIIKIENKKFYWWQQKIVTHRRTYILSTKYFNRFPKNIIFNHIYQHYVLYIVKDIDDYSVSMNVKIQELLGTGKKYFQHST